MADWTCNDCGWVNRGVLTKCLSCGAPQGHVAFGEPTDVPEPPDPRMLYGETKSHGAELAAPALPADWFSTRGLARGIAVAALAGIAATALWYAVVAFSGYEIAFVAIAVGWLVGTGAVFGARGRGSVWLAGASVGLALAALATSQYLITYHWMTQELDVAFEVIQSPDFVLTLIVETLLFDPLSLLFWGLALVYAGWVPLRAVQPVEESGP